MPPSMYCTAACRIDWRWISTRIRSAPIPKNSLVSMTSIALLKSDALSMVIRWPMSQFGWVAASSGVARAIRSSGQSRKAPPEAVMVMCSTCSSRPPARHCAMAECSLSTGISSAPAARAVASISGPAQTMLSLLASASAAPVSSAASPGASPA